MFQVLAPAPIFEKTDKVAFTSPDGKPVYFHRVTGWKELGFAKDYEEARQKFGGRPVLVDISATH